MSYRGNIWRYYTFRALVDCMLWLPVWVIYLQNNGFGLTLIGLLAAWELFVMTVFEVPSGALADRVGRRKILAAGASLVAFGGVVYVIAAELGSMPLLMASALPAMAGATFLTGVNEALLYDSLKADGRESLFNKTNSNAMTIVQASQALGGVGGGLLFAYLLQASPFLVTAALAGAAAVIALGFQEPPRTQDSGRPAPSYGRILRDSARTVATMPIVRSVVLCRALVQVAPFVTVVILLQPYARDSAVPVAAFGVLFMAMRGATMAGTFIGGRLNARRVSQWLLLTLLGTIAVLLIPIAVISWVGVLGIGVVSFLGGVQNPLLSATLNHHIDSGTRATVISIQSLLITLVMLTSQPVVGAVTEAWGYRGGFAYLAAFPLLAIVPVVLFGARLRTAQRAGGEEEAASEARREPSMS